MFPPTPICGPEKDSYPIKIEDLEDEDEEMDDACQQFLHGDQQDCSSEKNNNPKLKLLGEASVNTTTTENGALALVPCSTRLFDISKIKSCTVVMIPIRENSSPSSSSTETSSGSKKIVVLKGRAAQKIYLEYDEWRRAKAYKRAAENEAFTANTAIVPANTLPAASATSSESELGLGNASGGETTSELSVGEVGKIQHESSVTTANGDHDDNRAASRKNDLGKVNSAMTANARKRVVLNVPPIPNFKKREQDENEASSKMKRSRASGSRSAVSSVSTTPSSSTRTAKAKILEDCSQEELEDLMKQELKNEKPDFFKISDAMDKTFKCRRKLLASPAMDLSSALDQYPALSLYTMVKEDYGRIFGKEKQLYQLEHKLTRNLDQALTSEKVMKKRPGHNFHPLYQHTMNRWEQNRNCAPKMKKLLGMLALSFHLVEDCVVTHLCRFRSHGRPNVRLVTPTLVLRDEHQIFDLNTEMWIHVDGKKYLKVPNFYEGVLSVYATYYVFNILYEKPLKALFEFFDSLLGIPQSTYKNGSLENVG